MIHEVPVSDDERALLQQHLAEMIRSASQAERDYRASRARAMALGNIEPVTVADEIMWASIAAVAWDPALLDAVRNVRQVIILEDPEEEP